MWHQYVVLLRRFCFNVSASVMSCWRVRFCSCSRVLLFGCLRVVFASGDPGGVVMGTIVKQLQHSLGLTRPPRYQEYVGVSLGTGRLGRTEKRLDLRFMQQTSLCPTDSKNLLGVWRELLNMDQM